ncbi:MAG: hypothetical protein PHD04_00835 [Candidatus Pacebacteria bacterium]|nr:hypothetical protein [Candidatus Paceibacterota bacterium]
MPVDLFASQEQVAPVPSMPEGRDLLADVPEPDNKVLSWRQAPAPTMWEKMGNWFSGDAKAQSQKATNALVYSEMFGISPDTAYTYHDEISRQVQDKLSSEKVTTGAQGIGRAFSSGLESSLFGMMAKQKVPAPFESVNQWERWIQGMTAMGLDLPFFMAGYGIGGGTPITGTAGAFGFTSGLRQMLVDRYSKGEVKSMGELVSRIKDASYSTIKGQMVGAATGAAGLYSPAGFKLANELAAMTTAGRLVEGQLPTVQDFIDNAGILLIMHYGLKGYDAAKGRIPEIREKLQDHFIDSGAHPKTITEDIAKRPTPEIQEDLTDVLDQVNTEIKAAAPSEPIEKAKEQEETEIVPREAPPPQETGTTSIKNAVVDAEREVMGLPPIETPVTETGKNWREDVKAKVDSGEMNPREIAEKINNLIDLNEKIPGEYTTREWNQAFEYEKKQLQNEHKIVEDAITANDKAGNDTTELQQRRDEIELLIDANHKATKAIGTEQGRALQSRQDEMNEDYSFSAMIQRAKDDGIPITPEVRTKLKGISQKIEKAQQNLEDFDNQAEASKVDKAVKILKEEEKLSQRQEKRAYKKEELNAEFDSLVAELNKQLSSQLNIGIDPMAAKVLIDMARNRIKAGIITAEGIIDDIYVAVKKAGIEFSKRDIQDAISGYGITKGLNKEEIATKLREAKAQMRLLSALEDAKKGEAPLRTGLQRDKASDRVRELQRQVRQAMRESGIDSTKAKSPEEQWKTSLDAVKTRLKNSIADLVKRLETGQKEPKKLGIKYDEQAADLARLRDKIKEVLDFAEGPKDKPAMPPEQKIRMATKALEKSIAEYERRITENDLKPQKKVSTTPETPELKALRSERDLLKDIYKMMQDEEKPKKTPEEIALQSFRTRTENQIKDFERRLKEGDFSTKEKKEPPVKGNRELELQFELDKVKREYAKAHVEFQLAGRSLPTKIWDGLVEGMRLTRALKASFDVSAVGRQGWLAMLAHPAMLKEAVPIALRSLRSEEYAFAIDKQIRESPNYQLYKKAGVSFSEMGEGTTLKQMEEQFQSRWAENLPMGIGRGVTASERAYVTPLNWIRAKLFDEVYASTKFSTGKATDAELKAIGDYVNESTGRGNVRGYENALTGLGVFLWAPRLVLSRFQMLSGHSMWGGSLETKMAIAKEYGRMLRGLGIIYAVSSLFDDVSIEDSPLSTDFGKIRIGNRRIDVLAGLMQATVLLSRTYEEKTKKPSGAIVSLSGNVPYGGTTISGIWGNFLRTKLSPVISTALDIKDERDVVGNKVTVWDIPEKLLMPLSFGDIYDSMKEDGIPAGAALATLATFGIGVQIYDPRQRKQ